MCRAARHSGHRHAERCVVRRHPSLEYRNATWLGQVQIRNVKTGSVTSSYETDAVTSSLPKDTAFREMPLLVDKIQAAFQSERPGRSSAPGRLRPGFRNLDARKLRRRLARLSGSRVPQALDAFRRTASLDDQNPIAQAWLGRVSLLLYQRNERPDRAGAQSSC